MPQTEHAARGSQWTPRQAQTALPIARIRTWPAISAAVLTAGPHQRQPAAPRRKQAQARRRPAVYERGGHWCSVISVPPFPTLLPRPCPQFEDGDNAALDAMLQRRQQLAADVAAELADASVQQRHQWLHGGERSSPALTQRLQNPAAARGVPTLRFPIGSLHSSPQACAQLTAKSWAGISSNPRCAQWRSMKSWQHCRQRLSSASSTQTSGGQPASQQHRCGAPWSAPKPDPRRAGTASHCSCTAGLQSCLAPADRLLSKHWRQRAAAVASPVASSLSA